MGANGNLSDLEWRMVVGARGAGLFQKLLIYWDCHTQPSLGFIDKDLKTR